MNECLTRNRAYFPLQKILITCSKNLLDPWTRRFYWTTKREFYLFIVSWIFVQSHSSIRFTYKRSKVRSIFSALFTIDKKESSLSQWVWWWGAATCHKIRNKLVRWRTKAKILSDKRHIFFDANFNDDWSFPRRFSFLNHFNTIFWMKALECQK